MLAARNMFWWKWRLLQKVIASSDAVVGVGVALGFVAAVVVAVVGEVIVVAKNGCCGV